MPQQNDNDTETRLLQEGDNTIIRNDFEYPIQNHSKLIFAVFYALGTLGLIPQNFYITANDYWMYKFRDTNTSLVGSNSTNTTKTQLQKNFTSYYITVSNVTMVVFIIFTVIYAKRISIQKRVIGSISVMLFLFLITLVLALVDTDSCQVTFFVLSLIIGGLLNASSGCFLMSSFQLSAKFPAIYVGAQLSGQSICGILASLVQILTLSIGSSSTISALMYFSIAAIFILSVQILHVYVSVKQDYFQTQLSHEEEEEDSKVDRSAVKAVAKKMLPIMITMALSSGTTVMINPGMTSLIESSGKGNGRWNDIYFVPVCTYLIYHLWDFIGRECSLRYALITNIYIILTATVLRVAFVPLLMFCNIQPRHHLPVVFGADYYYIIFMIVFSFSAGYLVNLCIMEIPRICKPEEKKIATFLIVVVMVVSISGFSFMTGVIINLL